MYCNSNCNTKKHIISLFWSIRPTHLRRIKNLSKLLSLLSIWSTCLEMRGDQHAQTLKYTWKHEPHRSCWTIKPLKTPGLETDSPTSYHLWRKVENSWTLSRGQQQFYSFSCSFQTILRHNQFLADLESSPVTEIITPNWCHLKLSGIKYMIYDLVYWCFTNEKWSGVKQIDIWFSRPHAHLYLVSEAAAWIRCWMRSRPLAVSGRYKGSLWASWRVWWMNVHTWPTSLVSVMVQVKGMLLIR